MSEPPLSKPLLSLAVNGRDVEVADDGRSLLDVLRDDVGLTGAKDGCSPQGQCGCCTVLVDGAPRVACVTPARRVRGRSIETIEGLDPSVAQAWGEAFCANGGSQCGFCTPGIVMRLEAIRRGSLRREAGHEADSTGGAPGTAGVTQALLAHLCRCTGWQTIVESWETRVAVPPAPRRQRDLARAAERAAIEGRATQSVAPAVALGAGGFAADTIPVGALRAVPDGEGGWVVGETLAEARLAAAKLPGRRTTLATTWPLTVPEGDWTARLRTTWVEPAYLETDTSWCLPGGEPSSPLANGGAFGAKSVGESLRTEVMEAAKRLAARHGVPVVAMASREDTVRWGAKRPPVAGGVDANGRGRLRVVATPGIVEPIRLVAPGIEVEEVEVRGPSTSSRLRAAGWAEALVLLAGAAGAVGTIRAPNGAEARAEFDGFAEGRRVLRIEVRCGDPLDEVMLRSYCIGAAHMAYSWVTSEALSVDDEGVINDLTIRSFGIVRAVDTPLIEVTIAPGTSTPINGSDAVFAAVAAATWLEAGCATDWPVGSGRMTP